MTFTTGTTTLAAINLANGLDVRCARACKHEIVVDGRPMYMIPNHDHAYLLPPPFSTDHAWSHVLEDEIERRGLEASYIKALGEIVPHPRTYQGDVPLLPPGGVWALIRATPEQKARAFLEAYRV